MVENVQCPVCTLFLHTGMNLSDHLETHPKEQVIKALVQMTIAGVCGAGALERGDKSDVDTERKKPPEDDICTPIAGSITIEKEEDLSCHSAISNSSFLIASASCSSSNHSLNLGTIMTGTDKKNGTPKKCSTPLIKEQNNELIALNAAKVSYMTKESHAYQQMSIGSNIATEVTTKTKSDISFSPTTSNAYMANCYQQTATNQLQQKQQHQQLVTSQLHGQNHIVTTTQEKMPQPPPAPPLPKMQHTTVYPTMLSTSALLRQQLVPFNMQHLHEQQLQLQQQQQNLKIIYSPALPPPPPLQLFSYQSPSQSQHQKPPPAYGTAINQIRSQHNQIKQNVSIMPTQHHQQKQPPTNQFTTSSSTSKQLQSKSDNQYLTPTTTTTTTATITATITTATTPTTTATNIVTTSATHNSNSHPKYSTDTNQFSHGSQDHQHVHHTQPQHIQPQFPISNGNGSATNNYKYNYAPSSQQRSGVVTPSLLPPPTTPTAQLSALSVIPPASLVQRQTNSPFATANSAASSPSVLRFAESPVAHYLERDNGDFIVQEQPKHIVECVEKDNGEFSVIERFYQSPPSVLHIHDDDDDDDDGMDNVDHEEEHTRKNSAGTDDAMLNYESDTKETSGKSSKIVSNDSVRTQKNSNEKCLINEIGSDQEKEVVEKPRVCKDSMDVNRSGNESDTNTEVSKDSFSTANISTISNSTSGSGRKKSSKNSITVLSDVHLNLNEYLDLVGNIIASSKINAKRSTANNGPRAPHLSLLKVEKEEPADEYESEFNNQEEMEFNSEDAQVEPQQINNTTIKTIATEPPTIANNKNETDEIAESPICKSTSINKEEAEGANEDEMKHTTATPPLQEHLATEQSFASHATSVIRMATTSQQQQQAPQDSASKIDNYAFVPTYNATTKEEENVAEDLSQPQLKSEVTIPTTAASPILITALPPPPLKKGPRKLVIKPKSKKTDANKASAEIAISSTERDKAEKPTTSARAAQQYYDAQQEQRKSDTLPPNVVIKFEPSCESILEQHLKSGSTGQHTQQQMLECKKEKHFAHDYDDDEASASLKAESEDQPMISVYNAADDSNDANVADDARVLLDFANSKKYAATANFLSPSSTFSNVAATEKSLSTSGVLRCEDDYIVTDTSADVQEIVISSSYSSQSASDVAMHQSSANSTLAATANDSNHQPTFNDYPFSFMYGDGVNVAQQVIIAGKRSIASIYQPAHDASTIATLTSSGSNSASVEDASTTVLSQQQHRFDSTPLPATSSTVSSQWYHQTVSAANADFVSELAVECGTAVDNDVGRYLDLDACKQERIAISSQAPPSSSTSSSFTAATESSFTGCTTDAPLNIRTDEKMPAKGEISEQESNCDIENSWSQPMYGDISARFFRTSFPGIFPHDNGWYHDEFFTVQDLSAPTANAAATSGNNRPTSKSFDFRLPLEATTSGTAISNNLQLLSQNNEAMLPSTSNGTTNKKKRKRDGKNNLNATLTARKKPTATVTSQQLQQQMQQSQDLQLQQQQEQNPLSSTALMAGPSSAAFAFRPTSSGTVQQKLRKKIYQCTHCMAEFPKLKERNSHMIITHNYVRQNRRLICTQTETNNAASSNADLVAASSSTTNLLLHIQNAAEFVEDSKHAIVKIEVDSSDQQALSVTPINTNISDIAKTESVDNKDSLALVPTVPTKSESDADRKLLSMQPLALTTPASKLATLYRMLVSFNISMLKQNRDLTEFETKLIDSSIFFCYVCRCNFNSVKVYDAHLTEHPAECFTCGKKFQRWKNFSLHLKRHVGWKEFCCSVCGKKFVVRSALVEHMRMHTGHMPLKCKICGKHFKRYSNLTQHRKRHGKQIVRKKEYVCYCGEVLPSKARFHWHKETHDAKPKCCPHCCDRFVHANSLRRHIRLAHSDKFDYTEPMECPMCKQIFAKSSIKAHMATHSMETQHDCPICNKSFSTKWNLKIHSWVHANRTAKPFKCEHCPKAFVREVDFKNHMNAHKQIKPYTCEYCGCKFIRKYNYMRHRREHHGNKKFTCDLCKKSFHRHYYLIEHRRIHTGERPFQCTICGKSSTTKTNHNKHLKIHHSRDPFTVEA